MNKTNHFSLCIGAAYIALGLISLYLDVSPHMVNGVSIGALLFSVAELLCTWFSDGGVKRSILDILEDKHSTDRSRIAVQYIMKIQRERSNAFKYEKSIVYKMSVLLKIIAFMFIIVYPWTPMHQLFDGMKNFGSVCTILSLGVMLVTFYFYDYASRTNEIDDETEIIGCLNILCNKNADQTQSIIELLREMVELQKKITAYDEIKKEYDKIKKEYDAVE